MRFILAAISVIRDADFEWDDGKAAVNIRKHRLSFHDARAVFDDPAVRIDADTGGDYGEDRFVAIGKVDGLLFSVAFAERGTRICIISARRATRYEERLYHRG